MTEPERARPARGQKAAGWAAALWSLALLGFLLFPLAVIVHAALAPSPRLGVSSEQWIAGAGSGRAFRLVLATYGSHLRNSLLLAGAVVLGGLTLGVPGGVALGLADRHPDPRLRRAARAIELLVALPLGMPGLVVAMALLLTYPGAASGYRLLLVGHLLYTLPFVVGTVSVATRTSGLGALLAAAQTLGAGPFTRLRRVGWPLLRRPVASGALLSLMLSLGEFNITFLLASPARGTFPTALYLTYTTNSFPVAAAATTLFLLALLPLVGLILWLGRAPAAASGA